MSAVRPAIYHQRYTPAVFQSSRPRQSSRSRSLAVLRPTVVASGSLAVLREYGRVSPQFDARHSVLNIRLGIPTPTMVYVWDSLEHVTSFHVSFLFFSREFSEAWAPAAPLLPPPMNRRRDLGCRQWLSLSMARVTSRYPRLLLRLEASTLGMPQVCPRS